MRYGSCSKAACSNNRNQQKRKATQFVPYSQGYLSLLALCGLEQSPDHDGQAGQA